MIPRGQSKNQTPGCQKGDLYEIVESLPRGDSAWHLLDAFDAVTNGMENPGAMQKAAAVKDPSLASWKHLVDAIAALYQGDAALCEKAAAAMEEGSPPAVLKPLFRAWLIRSRAQLEDGEKKLFNELTGARAPVLSLFDRLVIEPHPLCLISEQAEEALQHGLLEQSALLAAKVLVSLKEISLLAAIKYTGYYYALLLETNSAPDSFCAVVQKHFRGAEDIALYFSSRFADRDQPEPQSAKKPAAKNGRLVQAELFAAAEFDHKNAPVKTKKAEQKKAPSLEDAVNASAFNLKLDAHKIKAALTRPASFDSLVHSLPSAVRYLGPGVWIKAIKDAFGETCTTQSK
ncbi:MAG: hypothetical protein LBJ31_11830 [Treponema sp.]|jgi:hypothetical protein|nr:hypothetical protein [Treponema sp.]